MNRRRFISTVAWLTASGLPAHASGPAPMALWVWLKEAAEFPAIVAFARRHGFAPLVVHLRRADRVALLANDRTTLAQLAAAREAGLTLIALAGDAQWARQTRLPPELRELFAINRAHALFSGLHLDVEPHTLDGWRRDAAVRAALAQGMVGFFQLVRRELDPRLPLSAALHPKAALTPVGTGDIIGGLAPVLQEVAIMAYRPNPAAQLAYAAPFLSRLETLGLHWRMGVLAPKPEAEAGTAYGAADFAGQLALLWQQVRARPLCRGLIVENARTAQRAL